ncbi:MAG: tRNA (guanosine(46)-N7)-methyltransferase TrmB [Alistipes sp.]|nr:tRNA (guanosine(46)-N7)-methyltransferase TrmB [Candidatus Alistipes equi]
MGKDKLRRFKENKSFPNVFEPLTSQIFGCDYYLKGRWNTDVFHNDNPIVLELGCGKGEYTVELARRNPHINYIGIDIKGARLWRGAKLSNEEHLPNVAFLRTHIEFLLGAFSRDEVSEIWITFPDPQLKTKRAKKRLTSPLFLEMYSKFLKKDGFINLKTDSAHLYGYTLFLAQSYSLEVDVKNEDIYGSEFADETLSVKTAYEKVYLSKGLPIRYLRFSLGMRESFERLEWEEDKKLLSQKDDEKEREDIRRH